MIEEAEEVHEIMVETGDEDAFVREADLIEIVTNGIRKLLPVTGVSESERMIFSKHNDERVEVPFDDAVVLRRGYENGYSIGKNMRRGTFLARLEDYPKVKILNCKKQEIELPVLGNEKRWYNLGLLLKCFLKTLKIFLGIAKCVNDERLVSQ